MEDTIDEIIGIIELNEPIYINVKTEKGYENSPQSLEHSTIIIKSKEDDIDFVIKGTKNGMSMIDNVNGEGYATASRMLEDGTEAVNVFQFSQEDGKKKVDFFSYLAKGGNTDLIRLITQVEGRSQIVITNTDTYHASEDEIIEYIKNIKLDEKLDEYIKKARDLLEEIDMVSAEERNRKIQELCELEDKEEKFYEDSTEYLDDNIESLEEIFRNYTVEIDGEDVEGEEKIELIRENTSRIDTCDVDRAQQYVKYGSLLETIAEQIERTTKQGTEKEK